jgi:hypothetical protein
MRACRVAKSTIPSNSLLRLLRVGFEPLESRGQRDSAIVQVYPSGQRGRAQDPLRSASQVQILPPAPTYSHFSVNSQL